MTNDVYLYRTYGCMDRSGGKDRWKQWQGLRPGERVRPSRPYPAISAALVRALSCSGGGLPDGRQATVNGSKP